MNSSHPLAANIHLLKADLDEKNIGVFIADTGLGKSTEVPKLLLDMYPKKHILVLEKRRIAVRTLANYVSKTMGTKAGYAMGGGENLNKDTAKILYATDAMLWKKPSLEAYKKIVVIIDECMKTDLNTYINIALGKKIASLGGKVVLLGAGIDESILKYLGLPKPSLEVHHNNFEVLVNYAGDLSKPLVPQVQAAVQAILAMNEPGDVLVFLPGVAEIEECMKDIVPGTISVTLFGQQDADTRALVFQYTAERKIIYATDIAEEAITLEKARYVIDGMRKKASSESNGFVKLEEQLISKMSAKNRKGRIGRVQPGSCWRLCTIEQFKGLNTQITPSGDPQQNVVEPIVFELLFRVSVSMF
jgi:ATP-dependent helicase HrpB